MGPPEADGPARALRVTRTVAIPFAELTWHYSTPGGPGGQHANRTASRVEVRFDVAASAALGPRQRARIVARYGPVVAAVAQEERSQARNRTVALERLRGRLEEGLRVERPRRPTAPSRASKERRLTAKHRRGEVKRERSFRPGED
ncbi:MAG: alternative ribosome rescue aminoacyl-tRNA hydrolase ArfB [Actinomycetota bacterium]|nr:alternative ribosome rescue aminoacyl-tRNA hydrolase ArfB [Actinomycetota bacterium]